MLKYLFAALPDGPHAGARRMSVYLLRLVYVLMFFVLGKDTWTHLLTHRGPWEPDDAMSWCVWTAFATLAGGFDDPPSG